VINSIPTRDRSTVEQYLAAMQAGPSGLEDLVALFDDQAVYVEPFMGQPHVHTGKAEIRAFFEVALQQNLNGKAWKVAPSGSEPSSTTWIERGICHQNSPVAHTAAASVRTIGVPTAPSAPYILEWESEATTNEPGTT